eukprot:Skav229674  [mRNA]  locus=scaffold4264:81999:97747:+ [translate_table: standard]
MLGALRNVDGAQDPMHRKAGHGHWLGNGSPELQIPRGRSSGGPVEVPCSSGDAASVRLVPMEDEEPGGLNAALLRGAEEAKKSTTLARFTAICDTLTKLREIAQEASDAKQMASQYDVGDEMRELALEESVRGWGGPPELRAKQADVAAELQTAMITPDDRDDATSILVEIRPGVGGDEACLWAEDLVNMYHKYCASEDLRIKAGGYQEATLNVQGPGAWTKFKFESGVHRVQRVPTTEKAGRARISAGRMFGDWFYVNGILGCPGFSAEVVLEGNLQEPVRLMAMQEEQEKLEAIDRYEIVEEAADPENPLAKGRYNIRVQNAGNYHIVRKRFAEFVTLHDFLKLHFGPGLMLELPKKTPIRYFNHDKLDDRKNALNVYLKDLCKRQEIVNLAEVQRFFGCQVSQPNVQSSGYAPQAQAPVVGAAPGKPLVQSDSEDDLARWDS